MRGRYIIEIVEKKIVANIPTLNLPYQPEEKKVAEVEDNIKSNQQFLNNPSRELIEVNE